MSILLRLALVGVLMLLFGEGVLRVLDLGHPYYSAPEAYVPKDDPEWRFALKPNFQGRSEGTWISINSVGFRDGEIELAHPDSTVRIMMLGDSVTFGPGVGPDETFSKVLEGDLRAADPSRQYQVINAGVVGYNTPQENAIFHEVGQAYHPNVVVLTFLVNDLLDTFSIFDHQYEPEGVLAPLKLWLRRESNLYRLAQNTYWQIAGDARRVGAPTEAVRPRARLQERQAQIVQLAERVRANGGRMLLALYPDNLDDRVAPDASGESRSMRTEMMLFATAQGLPVLDLSAAIGDIRDPRARQMRLREDPHPSVTGHRAIGDALAEALSGKNLLGTRSGAVGVVSAAR